MLRFLILACVVSVIHACGVPNFPPNEVSLNIVGGDEAKQHSWPWMTEVMKYGKHHCGATIINENWIVSAAHCFEKNPELTDYEFSVGGHVMADLNEATRQTFQATKIIRHADFSFVGALSNDIVLIRIEGAQFNKYVQPACLAFRRPDDDTAAYVTGWGDQETVIRDKDLQQVMVPIVNHQECIATYANAGYTVDHTMICAGYPNGGKDACQQDSGGPLVVKDKDTERWTLVGIVSWGIGCADAGYYGVYSDVAELYSWIQTTMANNQ